MKKPSNRSRRLRIKTLASRMASYYANWLDGIASGEPYKEAHRELCEAIDAALPDPPKKGAKKR